MTAEKLLIKAMMFREVHLLNLSGKFDQ